MFRLISHRTEDALTERIVQDREIRRWWYTANTPASMGSGADIRVTRFWASGMLTRSR